MHRLLRRLIFSIAVFAAFCVAGFLATTLTPFQDSIIASTAIFGVSFVGIVGGAVKLWYDIFV